MSVLLDAAYKQAELEVVVSGAREDILVKCDEIIKYHAPRVNDIITQTGLELLKNVLPVADRLGMFALNGFYQSEWLDEVRTKFGLTGLTPLTDDNELAEGHILQPLRDLFWELSPIGCRNEQLDEHISLLEQVENDDIWPMHPDEGGGHTFLSNFLIDGPLGAEYVFQIDGEFEKFEMIENQLVIIAGSSVHLPETSIFKSTYASVDHQAVHRGTTTRIRFNTYRTQFDDSPS